jgi:uncharacterized membrane protein
MSSETFRSGRAFDRLINFSDAVVAVAVTVLVLPIADITVSRGDESVWNVLSDHAGEIITFFFTFFVVSIMWLTHNRFMNQLRGYDGVIFWLNTAWLAIIAFLPVTSALYSDPGLDGSGGWFSGTTLDGSGMLYWGSLSLISFIITLMSLRARSNTHLYDPEQAKFWSWREISRGWIYASYFLIIGVVSLFSAGVASYLPLGLIVLPFLLKREDSSIDID